MRTDQVARTEYLDPEYQGFCTSDDDPGTGRWPERSDKLCGSKDMWWAPLNKQSVALALAAVSLRVV